MRHVPKLFSSMCTLNSSILFGRNGYRLGLSPPNAHCPQGPVAARFLREQGKVWGIA